MENANRGAHMNETAPSDPPPGHEPIPTTVTGDGRAATWGLRLVFYGPVVLVVYLMFQDLPREVIGGLGIALAVVLMLMKVPVAAAMLCGGTLGILALGGPIVLSSTLSTLPFQSTASWSLSVVPMFVLMGLLLWRSGASERLYSASRNWIGWLPGGLAVGTNFAGTGLATVSGSTLGVTYALGRVGIPEMLRAGYDRRFATASVLMAGTGGQLIPPSILLVIYAGIASVPVGPQLLAGLLPGVVLALAYGLLLIGLAAAFPHLVGKSRHNTGTSHRQTGEPEVSWTERWHSLGRVWPIPLLAVTMLLGLYLGVFTATEAGAFGVAGAVVIALCYQGVRPAGRATRLALADTVRTSAAIFLLLIGAEILSRFLTLSGAATWMVTAVDELGLTRLQFLLMLMVMYLFLGMFMDSLTMMLITVPILMPILEAQDVSLLWFGIFVVLLGELAVVTPPLGVLTFVVHKMAQDKQVNLGQKISLSDVFVSVLWFLPISLAVLVLLILFPQIAEIIPLMSDQ